MKIGDLRPWRVGDRLRLSGHTYVKNGKTIRSTWYGVMEVVRVEERGIVCDLLQLRGDSSGQWRNIGHRFLYEWVEDYEELEKL